MTPQELTKLILRVIIKNIDSYPIFKAAQQNFLTGLIFKEHVYKIFIAIIQSKFKEAENSLGLNLQTILSKGTYLERCDKLNSFIYKVLDPFKAGVVLTDIMACVADYLLEEEKQNNDNRN